MKLFHIFIFKVVHSFFGVCLVVLYLTAELELEFLLTCLIIHIH